jgi:hypothetical protein
MRANGLPKSLARNPGVVKIPAPITLATTTEVAVKTPMDRSSLGPGLVSINGSIAMISVWRASKRKDSLLRREHGSPRAASPIILVRQKVKASRNEPLHSLPASFLLRSTLLP